MIGALLHESANANFKIFKFWDIRVILVSHRNLFVTLISHRILDLYGITSNYIAVAQ